MSKGIEKEDEMNKDTFRMLMTSGIVAESAWRAIPMDVVWQYGIEFPAGHDVAVIQYRVHHFQGWLKEHIKTDDKPRWKCLDNGEKPE